MTMDTAQQAPAHEHLWHEDSDDEGRTFQACVRCPARKVTGTTATRW